MLISQVVEICKVDKSELTKNGNGVLVVPSENSKWITIKWIHAENYDTQEEINDSAEIFVSEILRDTNGGVFIRIQDVIPHFKKGAVKETLEGYRFETRVLLCK